MSIKWAKSVPSFLQLQESDQTLLLEESWAQLFIIGLAQWTIRFDEGKFQLLRARVDSSARENIQAQTKSLTTESLASII